MSTFSYSSTLQIKPTWTEELDVTSVVDKVSSKFTVTLENGTGDNQADAYWKDVITLSAGGSGSLDLSALSTTFMGGTGTLNFAKVKALLVVNQSTTESITIGGTITDQWTALSADAVTVGPSGQFYMASPLSGFATSGTDKVVALANGGSTAADIEVYVIGVLA